jgi:hypothetical protein
MHASSDRALRDVATLRRADLVAVVQMNVDSLAEPSGEAEDDVELTFDVAVETRRIEPPDQVGAGPKGRGIRSGAPFSVITPLCGKASSSKRLVTARATSAGRSCAASRTSTTPPS